MNDESNTKRIGGIQTPRAAITDSALPSRGKNEQIGKDEFLQMLVTQLKNQDPLDPMKNDQFAVNLAQFSQLEQLIQINHSLDGDNQGDVASLSGYLGTEVTLNESTVSVKDNDGGRVRFTLPSDATDVKLDLTREDGSVIESVELGDLSAGSYSVNLTELNTAFGEFGIQARATGASGIENEYEAFVAGIVTGFIPGPDAALLIGDRRISTADVREVNLPAA